MSSTVLSRKAASRATAFCAILASQALVAEPQHPFAALAGAWAGTGTIATLTGVEHATCNVLYQVAGSAAKMSLTCVTESYRLNLTSAVVDKLGMVSGRWSEQTFGTSGSLAGHRDGDRLGLTAAVAGAVVDIVIATQHGRQTVSLKTTSPLVAGGELVLLRQS